MDKWPQPKDQNEAPKQEEVIPQPKKERFVMNDLTDDQREELNELLKKIKPE